MDVLKWCKNNSKWLNFPPLFHVTVLIILFPAAEMVKKQVESSFEATGMCECPFLSLESSILTLSIHPAHLYYALEKESLWDGDGSCSKTPRSQGGWQDASHVSTSLN